MLEQSPSVRLVVRPDGVAVLAMSAVDPFESSLFEGLLNAFEQAVSDVFVRAIVLTSDHPRVFARSGISTMRAVSEKSAAKANVDARHRLADRIVQSPKPTVAAVHGAAFGVGFEIALACSARIMSNDARSLFALSEVRVGLAPSFHGLQRLADLIGFERALRVGMTGTMIDPAFAVELGIASESTEPSSLIDRAVATALARVHEPRKFAKTITASSLYERSGLGKRVFMARAKRALVESFGRDATAQAKMIAILEAYAKRGALASYAVEREAFAELAVASATRRSVEIVLATEALDQENRAYVASFGRHAHGGSQDDSPLDTYEVESVSAHPVPSPRLVEILADPATDQGDVAQAIASAQSRDKVVVVTRKHTGGFIRRVLFAYLNEACWLVGGGSSIDHVDRALVAWGFPIGPIALLDALGPATQKRLGDDLEAAIGSRFKPAPFLTSFAEITRGDAGQMRRLFRSPPSKNGREAWWDPVLRSRRPPRDEVDGSVFSLLSMPFPDPAAKPLIAREEVQMRCALQLVNETLHCFEEGIVGSARDADVATTVGIGFPVFRGGALAYVDTIGAAELLARMQAFRQHVGERFDPAPILTELAANGRFLRRQ